jgi:hypothetical protein
MAKDPVCGMNVDEKKAARDSVPQRKGLLLLLSKLQSPV